MPPYWIWDPTTCRKYDILPGEETYCFRINFKYECGHPYLEAAQASSSSSSDEKRDDKKRDDEKRDDKKREPKVIYHKYRNHLRPCSWRKCYIGDVTHEIFGACGKPECIAAVQELWRKEAYWPRRPERMED